MKHSSGFYPRVLGNGLAVLQRVRVLMARYCVPWAPATGDDPFVVGPVGEPVARTCCR
jgi:hypothetical protein